MLAKLSNGWVCILVPACGVASINNDLILVERKEPSVILLGDLPNISIKRIRWVAYCHKVGQQILPITGHSLVDLKMLGEDNLDQDNFDLILGSCPNLKHLRVELCHSLASPQLIILKAYQQDRRKLENLTLNEFHGNQQNIVLKKRCCSQIHRPNHFSVATKEQDISSIDDLITSCRSYRMLKVLIGMAVIKISADKSILSSMCSMANYSMSVLFPA